MCGIVGYVGYEDVKEIILSGLEKLEYRGYDSAGIGHTRSATHGEPNRINSHPHQSSSKRFTLVHNGIIENEEELKNKYLKGVQCKTDTDTEVIVQLIEKFVNDGEAVDLAIRHTMSELKGSYALAILDKEDMNTLYAAKNKTPLLAGKGNGFNILGSDAMAMINFTNLFFPGRQSN
jgi:glucosamine--fructose-6-phosphate aminotransferase (isomerizing)